MASSAIPLSARLREARLALDQSPYDVSYNVGGAVSPQSVVRIEQGLRAPYPTLVQLSDALGVDPEEDVGDAQAPQEQDIEQQLQAQGAPEQPPPPPDQTHWQFWAIVSAIIAAYAAEQAALTTLAIGNINAGKITTPKTRFMAAYEARQRLDRLGAQTDPMIEDAVHTAVFEGAHHTEQSLLRVSDLKPAAGGTNELNAAAEALVNQLQGDLAHARTFIGRQIDDVYARVQRAVSLEALTGFQGSPQEQTKRMVELLREQGIRAFEDRTGRQWQLEAYAAMATRTTTAAAATEGQLQTIQRSGLDLMRIVEAEDACPICAPWRDVLISLSGAKEHALGMPVVALEKAVTPPIHPNCRCALVPVIESPE